MSSSHSSLSGASPVRHVTVALLLFLFALPSKSQEASPPPSTTFHSSSNLVVLDVVVTDRSGRSVKNLSQNDFTVLEDGVAQTVTSFEAPEAGRSEPGRHRDRSEPAVDAEKSGEQNAPPSPQALDILVLDELNSEVLDQAYARGSIDKFLDKRGPHLQQPTSLMLLGQKRLELLHDYTQDGNALKDALRRRHAELPFGVMTAEFSGAGERLSKTLWALQQIASANSHYAGRKNVIWIGPGFPAINTALALDAADRPRFISAISEDANLLLKARVSVYTINPRGLEVSPTMYSASGEDTFMTGTQDQATGELLFEAIAPETGGTILRLRNDVDAAIAQSVDDGSAYYSLAYYPKNHDWNGKYRRVRVMVKGQGLQARARRGYYGIGNAPLSDHQIDTELSRAVMSPLPYHALEVEAKAKSAGAGRGRFIIKVDPTGLQWETLPDGKHRCEVTVVVASVGASERVFSHKVTELESTIDAKHFERERNKPVTFNLVTDMPPKTTYVRIVVRDAQSDHLGSTDLAHDALPFR